MRGKGEGSLFKDGRGLWTATIELPSPGATRRRKVIRSKDKKVLLEKVRVAKEQLRKHGDMPTGSETVEVWFRLWLETIAVKTVRPKTLANYRSITTNHIIPTIGKVRLDRVTAQHVRRVHDRMTAAGLSSTSALTAHGIMSSAFTAAEREGRMSRNPAQLTAAPRRQTVNLEVLTVEEASRLIQTFGQSEQAYLWATFLMTGARRGELLGLEWDRVTDVLDLSWQLQRHPTNIVAPADYEYRRLRGGLYLTRPKSRSGTRIVPLVQPLLGILERWRAASETNEYGLVFATSDGQPIDPDYATHEWPKVLRAAGISRRVRLHDLRHTAIDLMAEAGVEEDVIREIVGHSTLAMTRAYRSRSTRNRLTVGLEPFAALFTQPLASDTPKAIAE
jgi:integrase